MFRRFTLLSILVLFLASCTHSLHVANVSDFSPTFKEYNKGQLVKSRSEQFTVLGFVTNTDYADEAYTKLIASCPGGNIQGIATEYSTSHGFFSWTNTIDMQGLCVR